MSDSIDITDLVEKMRSTFVSIETEASFQALASVQGLQWLRLPLISSITKKLIELVISGLSKRAVMMAFFSNTAIRKASQAQDYVNAVNAKESLTDVSDEVYEKAELAEISAFNDFVRVTA